MNKLKRNGFILISAGLVIFLVGFILSGFDVTKACIEIELETKEMTVSGDTRIIQIEDAHTDIEILPSPDRDIHISYYESIKERYDITAGSTLFIVKDTKFSLSLGLEVYTKPRSLIVQLPVDYNGKLELDAENCDVFISDVFTSELDIKAAYSPVTLTCVTIKDRINLHTVKGDISIDNATFDGFASISSDVDDISLKDVAFAENTNIKAYYGSISLLRISGSKDISLYTHDGDITGSILGSADAFHIEATAPKGSCNLVPSAASSGNAGVEDGSGSSDMAAVAVQKLTVETRLGDISISFE